MRAVRHAGPAKAGAARAAERRPPNWRRFFLKFGEGYLAISQAFSPDVPGLDHYSLGIRDYDKAKLMARLQDSGMAAQPRPGNDLWVADLDGSLMQLRPTGGWARQTATPYQPPARVGPALSPLSMSRIGLPTTDLAREAAFYRKLFGTEVASADCDAVLLRVRGRRRRPRIARRPPAFGPRPSISSRIAREGFHGRGSRSRPARTRHQDGRQAHARHGAFRRSGRPADRACGCGLAPSIVMPAPKPAWMAGTSPATTLEGWSPRRAGHESATAE